MCLLSVPLRFAGGLDQFVQISILLSGTPVLANRRGGGVCTPGAPTCSRGSPCGPPWSRGCLGKGQMDPPWFPVCCKGQAVCLGQVHSLFGHHSLSWWGAAL